MKKVYAAVGILCVLALPALADEGNGTRAQSLARRILSGGEDHDSPTAVAKAVKRLSLKEATQLVSSIRKQKAEQARGIALLLEGSYVIDRDDCVEKMAKGLAESILRGRSPAELTEKERRLVEGARADAEMAVDDQLTERPRVELTLTRYHRFKLVGRPFARPSEYSGTWSLDGGDLVLRTTSTSEGPIGVPSPGDTRRLKLEPGGFRYLKDPILWNWLLVRER